jgi:hypothetical protein
MFPKFFKHKMREVKSFLRIMRGKASGNKDDRVKGVDQALDAMEDERKVYQQEKQEALREKQPEAGQDISAI